mmetsp:Transcript_50894/g.80731  ORF Transcript_50894/g.80731 Transcript_50894/m.80731 type:complete len:198 (+) Transcript_50894:65-658(+)
MSRYTRKGGPIRFNKVYKHKEYRSPTLYGWYHNTPWSKLNNFSYFWSEHRPIRKTVVNHAQRVKQIRTFGSHLEEAPGVIQELSQQGPFTFFCPNNDAMDLIRDAAWEKLWTEEKALFFRHHALRGKWDLAELVAAAGTKDAVVSMADQELPISTSGSLESMNRIVRVADAVVTKGNVRCWNGIVHVIDRPLLPRWR